MSYGYSEEFSKVRQKYLLVDGCNHGKRYRNTRYLSRLLGKCIGMIWRDQIPVFFIIRERKPVYLQKISK